MRKPWKHKKAAALALCVSLWMAGGSVAGARDTTVTDADNTGNGTWVYGNNNGTVLTDGTDPPSNNTIAVELTTRTLNTVYGAYFVNFDDIVSGNTVNIIKGTVINIANGGQSDTGAVTDNHVNISGGIVSAPGAGGVVGGQSFRGAATKNTVTISGTANVKGDVYGAMSYTGNAGGSKEAKNTVTISGGTVGTAGGNTAIIGGGAGGTASYNEVAISGGIVYSDIWGGTGDTANNNTVEISGGTINSAYIRGGRGTTEASGNTVTISGNATINALDSAYIYGGAEAPVTKNNTVNILTAISVRGLYGGMGATTSSGNTLNLAAKGVKVGEEGVAGFQNYNFFLPTTMTTTDTMLTVNGTAYVDGAKVGVLAQGKLDSLKKDDKVTLLHADTLNGTVSQTTEIDVPESIATVNTYEFNVTSDANNIYATITKAPEEGGGESGGGSYDSYLDNGVHGDGGAHYFGV
ncbi:MAG: hypothetical protein J6Z82_05580, partial [Schwartzia sp.]|nr:hypothetical protein [Schwartzia sp. (in: firmicutes)]